MIRYLAIGLIAILAAPQVVSAAYLLSLDAAEAESRIVVDTQRGQLDLTNLAPGVAQNLFQLIQNPPPLVFPPQGPGLPPTVVPQGDLGMVLRSQLQKVCPVGEVSNPYGLQYTFRSVHAQGKLDWIVGTANNAQIVISISVMKSRGKPPAMLPIVPSNSPKDVTPSVEMGCLTEDERLQAQREKVEACKTLGGSYCTDRR
jgi:hypothetical protein